MLRLLVAAAAVAVSALPASAQDAPPRRRGVVGQRLPPWAEGAWMIRRHLDDPWALVGARVVDVRSGDVLEDACIVVRGDLIVSVSTDPPPEGTEVVDVSGKYVVPGFFDLHAHVVPRSRFQPGAGEPEETLLTLLRHGVTTIRCLPLVSETVYAWSAQVNSGALPGPTIVPASSVFEQRPGRTSIGFGDPTTVEGWVRKEALLGARWIKVYDNMDAASLGTIINTAAEYGMKVCGHASQVPPLDAALMGMGSIEHITGIPWSCLRDDAGPVPEAFEHRFAEIAWYWEHADDDKARALMATFRDTGTAWVPTLVVSERIVQVAGHDGRQLEAADVRRLQEALRRGARLAVHLHRIGGLVAVGTDFPIDGVTPGDSVHREMELLVEAGGATPLEALQMATISPARVLGFGALLGTVEPGRIANLVVLEADPLRDISATRGITLVVHDGRRYPAP